MITTNSLNPFDGLPKDSDEDSLKNAFQSPYGNILSFYLSGTIEDPKAYSEWIHRIRSAQDTDLVMLFINSHGGSAAATLQLINAMRTSPAKVLVKVEGECMSAATMLLLAADMVEISDHSIFMIHNFSAGAFGKGAEIKAQVDFLQNWSTTLMEDLYAGFLSEGEIIAVLENRDIWMTADEVRIRLGKKTKYEKAKKTEEQKSKKASTKRSK